MISRRYEVGAPVSTPKAKVRHLHDDDTTIRSSTDYLLIWNDVDLPTHAV